MPLETGVPCHPVSVCALQPAQDPWSLAFLVLRSGSEIALWCFGCIRLFCWVFRIPKFRLYSWKQGDTKSCINPWKPLKLHCLFDCTAFADWHAIVFKIDRSLQQDLCAPVQQSEPKHRKKETLYQYLTFDIRAIRRCPAYHLSPEQKKRKRKKKQKKEERTQSRTFPLVLLLEGWLVVWPHSPP